MTALAYPLTAAANPSPFTPAETLALEFAERDFMMALHAAAPQAVREACGLAYHPIGEGQAFLASAIDVLAWNRVLGLGMETPATEADLEALVDLYDEAGVPRFFVQLSPAAAPPSVYTWLRQHGFRHYNNWVKLVHRLDTPWPEAQTDLRLEAIGPDDAAAFARLVTPPFDWPADLQPMLAACVGQPGWRHYLAFDGDRPVAGAALFIHDGCAYLGPAATAPAYQQRGAQGAFIDRRLHDAQAMGCTCAVVDTAAPRPGRPVGSLRNLLRYGFDVAYLRPNYCYGPGLCP